MSYLVIVKARDYIGAAEPDDNYLMVEPVYSNWFLNRTRGDTEAIQCRDKEPRPFEYVIGIVTGADWAWSKSLDRVRVDAINILGFHNDVNDFEHYHRFIAANQDNPK